MVGVTESLTSSIESSPTSRLWFPAKPLDQLISERLLRLSAEVNIVGHGSSSKAREI